MLRREWGVIGNRYRVSLGVIKTSELRQWIWLHNSVTILKTVRFKNEVDHFFIYYVFSGKQLDNAAEMNILSIMNTAHLYVITPYLFHSPYWPFGEPIRSAHVSLCACHCQSPVSLRPQGTNLQFDKVRFIGSFQREKPHSRVSYYGASQQTKGKVELL